MPTEKLLDALGLDALTGFSEETWAEFLLGLAQHSGDINRFFGRHEDAHWNTLTIGKVKEWYEYRSRQQHALEAPQPSTDRERSGPTTEAQQQAADMKQKGSTWLLEYWRQNPQLDGNPEWEIKKILQGRAPDEPSLTEREKQIIALYRRDIQEQCDIASGKREPMDARWMPATFPASIVIEPYKPRSEKK